MQSTTMFAALFLCTLAVADARANLGDHPIAKVVGLLQELKHQAQEEGKQEAIAFDKFMYWCSTNKAKTSEAIADGKARDEVLVSTVDGKTKEDRSLRSKIHKLEDEITEREASEAEMKKTRGEEEHLFDLSQKEFEETIQAVEDALAALKDSHDVTEGKLALVAKNVKKVVSLISLTATAQDVKTLSKFAQEPEAMGDRAAHVDDYSFKSGNVIELLKGLRLKFQDAKQESLKRETHAVSSHKVAMLAEDDAIESAEKSKDGKTVELSDTDADLAEAKSDDEVVVEDVKGDTASLEDITTQCRTKTSEWEKRSKTREEEIKAMDSAIEILAKVGGVRTEAPENPVLPAAPAAASGAFLQLPKSDPAAKAVLLVRQAAKKEHSKALERLAEQLSAHASGPFDQMNNMIQKMIQRLMAEQTSEDEHKLWCDKELSKTQTMVDEKQDKSDHLHADITANEAEVAELTNDISEATEKVAEMEAYMKEATEIRQVGHEENAAAAKDAKGAEKALANAIAVLETHYKESGEIKKESWEFVQTKKGAHKQSPDTWSASYTGTEGGGEKIIGVLKTISEDFAKMSAETEAQETNDQHEFDKSMSDTKIEKARRSKEIEMKEASKARKVEKINSLKSRAKDNDGELEKANQYAEDLKPACVNGDSSYEDRKSARDAEIKALHEAQDILSNAFKGGFMQKKKKSLRHIKPRK